LLLLLPPVVDLIVEFGIKPDDGISRFIVAACCNKPKEGIEKHRRRLLERDPVMLAGIGGRLLGIPHKGCAVQFEAKIHGRNDRRRY
jgi:hypothetical protein